MEEEHVCARELELEQEFNLRLERAVQERVRERTRRAEQETSPERRRRSAGRQDDGGDGDGQVEGGCRVPRNDREELQRRMDALENCINFVLVGYARRLIWRRKYII